MMAAAVAVAVVLVVAANSKSSSLLFAQGLEQAAKLSVFCSARLPPPPFSLGRLASSCTVLTTTHLVDNNALAWDALLAQRLQQAAALVHTEVGGDGGDDELG